MSTIRRILNQLRRTVRDIVRPCWRIGVTWVTQVARSLARLWAGIRHRHQQRMDADPSYPIALVAGLTAGFGVLVGHPAIAAGVGLAAGEILGVRTGHDRRTGPSSRYESSRSRWDDDHTGRTLWDRNEWDED